MTSERSRWRFEAIGTQWEIETDEPLDDDHQRQVTTVIEGFDKAWSRFRSDSLVADLARGANSVPLPADATAMLDAYAALSAATSAAVNPLIGEALAARGYDDSYSFTDRGAQPTLAEWQSSVSWHGGRLSVVPPATLDVGALGKGRLVDLIVDLLAEVRGGIVVDASGDLSVRGSRQRVALEHPFDPRRAIGVWEISDAALCASSINRRSWGNGLHHVLDARTGEPVQKVAATWAVASRAMVADGLATALFFDGGPRLARDWGVQWVRMFTDGQVQWSPGCDAELFRGR
ncbi:FAD:protein FMN transferase [Microbacterium sp. NPDC076911]|uniref:FAD:protein FMN transferase n=1 Tax=Microbacterium sp. NPDC076911 TaxID=3154958 RepID=UPI00342C3038